MDTKQAVEALASLAQEHRLKIFRLAVEAGQSGLSAGAIADRLGVPPSSLSFHLAHLKRAELLTQERQSRTLIYRANYPMMNRLIAFMLQNCCAGDATAVDLLNSKGACP
ncbi:ArsR/SmtB family transcription factor [Alterisphingorhabdus coralli]|uniref:Metalloregulator ArsR/SmtB family transcription factor n=1 Tax=Alterisphingorhabdus coralli TaxID=3071408 RepID=A0AA97F8I8_9SPHN|nr:metalloregulator ArsR/SmtB family transcription factor [Parasphingorhabdus sp. SCSIO 66989]WOE75943.1 metalloregulator ArsR/SmtB family transcription factor [Parasphingorhabdus sp. SCSIO 66989]